MPRKALSFRFAEEVVDAWLEEAAERQLELTAFVEDSVSAVTSQEARKAHRLVREAIASGEMEKGACAECGTQAAEAHHDDYAKPLQVRWLCRKHHRLWHRDHPSAISWGHMTVRIPQDLQTRLKIQAIKNDKTIQEIVNGLVEAYCRKKEAEGD